MKIKDFLHKCRKHIIWFVNSLKDYMKFTSIINTDSCVFFSHNGDSAGGAPVVLLELACSIKEDENIIFLCGKPGGIFELCKDNKIQVFSTYLLQRVYIYTMKRKKIKALVVNTVALAKTMSILNNCKCTFPIFWWIHEEKNLIVRNRRYMPSKLKSNIHILCVSDAVQLNLNDAVPEYCGRSKVFYYGCRDMYSVKNEEKYLINKNKQFTIAVIGRICVRKNQEQVVQAYNLLPKDIREKIRIQFIYASAEEKYLSKLKALTINDKNIYFVGAVPRNEMDKVYYSSDLIICSSIDDPLPVVITEAMMLKIPFVTSSKTGQYYLIENGTNGYKYDVDSIEELKKKILCVYNEDDLETLKEEERKLYLEYFTLDVVKRKFEMLLSNYSNY